MCCCATIEASNNENQYTSTNEPIDARLGELVGVRQYAWRVVVAEDAHQASSVPVVGDATAVVNLQAKPKVTNRLHGRFS